MNDVQPYAFGRAASEPTAAIGGVEKLGERLAKRLRAIVEPFSGGRPLVSAKPLDNTMFMMWDACVPSFVSLTIYRLHPMKGPVTMRIDAELVSLLVDRFYGGGSNPRHTADRREFTPTETRLAARLAESIVAALVDCWAEIVPVEAVLIARETNVSQAEIMAGDAQVVVQAFEIDLGDHAPRLVEIVYPKDGLAGLEIGGADKAIEDMRPADPVWQTLLANRLDDVRFPARTVLARPNLKIAELVALKPGDVIPIHISRHLPLLIGERVFAHGSIGEQDGCAAFMIEKLA
jgi:flagellar motor switch protein FliM